MEKSKCIRKVLRERNKNKKKIKIKKKNMD